MKRSIIDFLKYANINEFSVFPDSGGLAPFLKSIVGLQSQESSLKETKAPVKLEIHQARYGTQILDKDVTEILKTKIAATGELDVIANNDLFGDPHKGHLKKLTVKYTSDMGANLVSEVSEHGRLRLP